MKNIFRIFIALMLSLSMALLASCGDKPPVDPDNPDETIGPPVDDTPLVPPEEWQGIQGPLVDYIP